MADSLQPLVGVSVDANGRVGYDIPGVLGALGLDLDVNDLIRWLYANGALAGSILTNPNGQLQLEGDTLVQAIAGAESVRLIGDNGNSDFIKSIYEDVRLQAGGGVLTFNPGADHAQAQFAHSLGQPPVAVAVNPILDTSSTDRMFMSWEVSGANPNLLVDVGAVLDDALVNGGGVGISFDFSWIAIG